MSLNDFDYNSLLNEINSSIIIDQPIYSKIQKEENKNKINKLTYEVESLEQILNSLKKQFNKNKENNITQGELEIIKIKTKDEISQEQINNLFKILKNYSKTIKQNYKLINHCQLLLFDISEEENFRNEILEEKNYLNNLFNFSDLLPKKFNFNFNLDENIKFETEINEKKLKSFQNEFFNSFTKLNLSDIQYDVINEIIKENKIFTDYSLIETPIEKNEIQRYTLISQNLDFLLINLEKDVEFNHQKLLNLNSDLNLYISNSKIQINTSKIEYEKYINELNYKINELEEKIEFSAQIYDNLLEEINELKNIKIQKDKSNLILNISEQFEEEEESLFEFSNPNIIIDETEEELINKRNNLILEIQQFEKNYHEIKKIIIEKENRNHLIIKKLYEKYKNNKKKLKNNIEVSDSNSFDF